MILELLIGISLISNIITKGPILEVQTNALSSRAISLEKRYADAWVNDVFKDNILLNLAYMRGIAKNREDIDWNKVKQPFKYEFVLKTDELFTYHEDVLPTYQGKIAKTSGAHFNLSEGFKSDGWLVGDGVCHLASIIHWAAKDAGLESYAPASHDFAVIPEIPREYGVSIYFYPGRSSNNAYQNLYVKNTRDIDVIFVFDYDGENLKVEVHETQKGS